MFGGCSANDPPPVVSVPQVIKERVPPALARSCDVSNGATPTNGALVTELKRVRSQRDTCAARMDGIIEWNASPLLTTPEDVKPSS
jgi:hypothetical protein